MDKQQKAIQMVSEGKNVFITGSGGVGKSWVIKRLMEEYKNKMIFTAPTGIAALNIEAMTCHRAFGLPIGLTTANDFDRFSPTFNGLFSLDSPVEMIGIDEVGMLRLDYFELIDFKLRNLRRNNLPFGGLQVVAVGDFYQLEPIVSANEEDYYYRDYNSKFSFASKSWNFENIELTKIYRQDNIVQVNMLNSIRKKDKNYKKALYAISRMAKPYDPNEDILHLCCYKNTAAEVNERWYSKIDSPEVSYEAAYTGSWNEDDAPVPKTLKLKVGTKVLLCANHELGEYVNGNRGVIRELCDDYVLVELEDSDKRIVRVTRNIWEKYSYTADELGVEKNKEAEFEQFPIKLGYGLTIHSAQGMTLDNVAINSANAFSHGQTYMALSRIRDLKNLRLMRPLNGRDVICDDEVRKFYSKI